MSYDIINVFNLRFCVKYEKNMFCLILAELVEWFLKLCFQFFSIFQPTLNDSKKARLGNSLPSTIIIISSHRLLWNFTERWSQSPSTSFSSFTFGSYLEEILIVLRNSLCVIDSVHIRCTPGKAWFAAMNIMRNYHFEYTPASQVRYCICNKSVCHREWELIGW